MRTVATGHHGSPLRLAVGLDGLALAALAAAVALIEGHGGEQARSPRSSRDWRSPWRSERA